MKIEGLAIPTGVWTTIREWGDTFRERIEPGAWEDIAPDVPLVLDHSDGVQGVLARAAEEGGSLTFREAKDGLRFEADLVDTQVARDTMRQIEQGLIRGVSWLWRRDGTEDSWRIAEDKIPERTITRMGRIEDISIVTWPAYAMAHAMPRSTGQDRGARAVDPHEARRVALAESERRWAEIGI